MGINNQHQKNLWQVNRIGVDSLGVPENSTLDVTQLKRVPTYGAIVLLCFPRIGERGSTSVVSLTSAIIPMTVLAVNTEEGYYSSAKYLQTEHHAKEMDTSAPIAVGYQFGNGWRLAFLLRAGTRTPSAHLTVDSHHATHRFDLVDTAFKGDLSTRNVEFFARQQR